MSNDVEIPGLNDCPEPAAKAFRNAIQIRDVETGTVLHRQGQETTEQTEALWGLLSGTVKTETLTDTEGRLAISFLHSGRWFGAAASMNGEPRLMSIQSVSPARLAVVRRGDFTALVRDHPKLWRVTASVMAQNVAIMLDRIGALMVNDSKERLRRILLGMCPRDGERNKGPIDLPLTQEEVALSANLTSRTVRKLLRELQDEGAIRVSHKRVTIL